VLEVLVVAAVIVASWPAIKALTPIPVWEKKLLAHRIVTKFSVFVLLPMAVIKLTGGNLGSYGIGFSDLRYQVKMGFMGLAIMLLADLTFAPIQLLGWSYVSWKGALPLVVAHIAALLLVARVLRSRPSRSAKPAANNHLPTFLAIFAVLCIASALALPRTKLVANLTYPLFATGFGEEAFFRGYVQSRLNRSFERPFHSLGVDWGWGLILAAVLFGSFHYLVPGGTVWWGVWTAVAGLAFGFLREKTGGVVAPAIVHGVPQTIIYVLMGGL